VAVVVLWCFIWLSPIRAQLVNDGATNTLNHVTNTISGGVTVGTNGSFTLLILTNGTLLTNSGNGAIGLNAGADSNSLRLTSLNTRWLMGFDLTVGSNGSFNRLVISNSAMAVNNFGILGFGPTSSNNEALVTASVWTNRNDLYLGYVGHGNSLTVTNGGLVTDNSALLGADPASSNNQALVTGVGSLWAHRASLSVGFAGTGNRLVVSNGATLFASNNVNIGSSAGSLSNWMLLSSGATLNNRGSGAIGINLGADANTALLSDTNTRWAMTNGLTVGSNSSMNRLIVSNGAQVVSGGGTVGSLTGSSSNQIIITGPGSKWSISGADLLVGNSGQANTMIVSNGGLMFNSDGGVGGFQSSSNNVISITGVGSSWSNSGDCFLGSSGPGNTLVVSNGSLLSAGRTFTIGLGTSSSNNRVVVDNGDLRMTNVVLGSISAGNSITITNGGTVFGGRMIVGSANSSTNNRLIVDSATFTATNAAASGLFEVRRGTNVFNSGYIETDRLLLTNSLGTFEFNGGTLITRSATVSNNTPFIVGLAGLTPAIWDVLASPKGNLVAADLQIGNSSSFNQLFITNGASLTNTGNAILGMNGGANSNLTILSGAGSRWVIGTDLHLGTTGAVNRVIVSGGAFLQDEIGVMGQAVSSSNNEVVVTDPGSIWNNLVITVGALGPANRLIVTNQGSVFANLGTVGGTATSTDNRVIVDGGLLTITNFSGSGYLDIRRGTNVFNSGTMDLDRLLLTNSPGFFEFNGGTLFTKNTTNSNGRPFNAGDGSTMATMSLAGGGFHSFADGLVIRSNATLTGDGSLIGTIAVQNGGKLAPGTPLDPLGIFILNNPPILQGTTVMDIANNGRMLPNDQLQVSGALTYGGALIVTNLGPGALNTGDEFFLFNASSYIGSFSSITLPPLAFGLTWTNKLSLSGTIQVVGTALKFSSITRAGTNLIMSGSGGAAGATYYVLTTTNLSIGTSNWTRLLTNQFDVSGNFSFTNGIQLSVHQTFYRLQVP
jgi:fibronectin-binding autotransporter adhesin